MSPPVYRLRRPASGDKSNIHDQMMRYRDGVAEPGRQTPAVTVPLYEQKICAVRVRCCP